MPIQSPIKSNTDSLSAPKKSLVDYKRIALGFILLLVSVGLVALVAYPLYTNYENNNVSIAEQKTKIEELDLRLAQLDKIKRIAGSIESTTKLTTQAVPEIDEIPVVMAMVQEISKASGVKLVDFSYAGMESSKPVVAAAPTDSGISDPKPQPTGSVLNNPPATTSTSITPAKGNYDIFKMQLTVKGKFDDIKNLINNLEQSRRILDVISFGYNIQASETQIVGDVITLKLTLASYFKKFANITTSVNIEQYADLIKKIESLKYTEIDLTNPNVGKIDPFSSLKGTPVPTPSGTPNPAVNNVEPSSFFNGTDNSSEVNVVELEGTGKTVNPTVEPDVEAEQGDTTKLLQDLMKAEGL